jgi:hypothetical protein
MSDDIPADLADKLMVKCNRRCCICRRFRPTKLQVHHIEERSQGGSNHEDNLIVVCLSCHTDVHSKVPFARRFSVEELKGHRDALVKAVEEGRLPKDDTDEADVVLAALLQGVPAQEKAEAGLSPEAVEVLLRAANTQGVQQGSVYAGVHTEGMTVRMGDGGRSIARDDRRTQAKYKHAIKQLVACGLLERLSQDVFEVTDAGYLAADEIMVSQGHADTMP